MDRQWQAKWVMDPEFIGLEAKNIFHKELKTPSPYKHKEALKNRHMLIRKSFDLDQVLEDAFIHISADDYYKLYVNGKFVGQGPAPAYPSNYYYNTYKLNDYLREGLNVVAVHVYYQGLINRVWNSGDYRQGLIAEVEVGQELVLATDATWKYQMSEAYKSQDVTGYDTQYLENIDGRYLNKHWKEESYDDGAWSFVAINDKDDHQLGLQPSQPLSVYEVEAKSVDCLEEGHYIIDFGHEITGQFKLIAKGDEGSTIQVLCGEELDDQTGRVRYDMRCNCTYQETYTLSGNRDVFEPYDYKGYRYVEVIAPKGTVIEQPFGSLVRHYPFDDQSFSFESDNQRMNQIMTICKNGVKFGAQEGFVDCPTREKGQYLGDFTISGHSHIYLTGKSDLYRKTLMEFAHSAKVCPGIMAVAPGAFMQEIADFSMQWPMQVYQYYMQTGDLDFLESMLSTLEGLEAYFRPYERKDRLLENVDEKWNLVDWPMNLRDDYDFDLSKPIGDGCHNVVNAYYYGMLLYCEKIREVLGQEAKSDLGQFKKAFVHAFYREDKALFVDHEGSSHSAIHSNAIPLYFDMFPTKDYQEVTQLIQNRVKHCGVYMAYFVLKALSNIGQQEMVADLILSLWSTMVEEGATTCFEAWGKDQKWNTSLCHPWASSPIPLMVEAVVGLTPGQPGWQTINFNPHIPKSLGDFRLNFQVATGQIQVERIEGDLNIVGPKGIRLVDSRG